MPAFSSAEDADRAIDRVTAETARVEQAYVAEQRACYAKFLTTRCLDAAKDRRRAALAELRATDVAAKAWLRKDKADRRDEALSQRRIDDERDVREREQEVKAREAAQERKRLSSEERQQEAARVQSQAPAPDTRALKQEQRLQQRNEQAARDQAQREKNVGDYDRKVKAAQERQREVAERQARKEAEQAGKAAPRK